MRFPRVFGLGLAALLLGALSLTASAAIVALWARSLAGTDSLEYVRPAIFNGRYGRREFHLTLGTGYIAIGRVDEIPVDDESARRMESLDSNAKLPRWIRAGDEWGFHGWQDLRDAGKVLREIGIFEVDRGKEHFTKRIDHNWQAVVTPDWLLLLLVWTPWLAWLGQRFLTGRARSPSGRG